MCDQVSKIWPPIKSIAEENPEKLFSWKHCHKGSSAGHKDARYSR